MSFVPRTLKSFLSGLGLLLMTASFVWWQFTVPPESPRAFLPAKKSDIFPVVVIDPGHGGQDSGATVNGILEKDITLDVAQRVDRVLQGQGLATVMTRVGDGYISLAERVALTNKVPECIFVSIHFNEGGKATSTGIETYYADHQATPAKPLVSWLPFLQRASLQMPNVESQSLAGFVQDALVARTHAANRGTKVGQYFVIANVRHPAILVEGGFLSNKDDINKLASTDYREQIAAAISEGVFRYREVLKQRPATMAVTTSQVPE